MAIAPNIVKKNFENLSIEELEEKYELLKKDYIFENKEQQVKYIIKNYLNASKNVNSNSTKIALEELLMEKTGKEYKIEPQRFEITLTDVINNLVDYNGDPFWAEALSRYFQKLNDVSEEDKMEFLIQLIQDKNNFNEFTKEITTANNVKEIYEEYKTIAERYCSENRIIG